MTKQELISLLTMARQHIAAKGFSCFYTTRSMTQEEVDNVIRAIDFEVYRIKDPYFVYRISDDKLTISDSSERITRWILDCWPLKRFNEFNELFGGTKKDSPYFIAHSLATLIFARAYRED